MKVRIVIILLIIFLQLSVPIWFGGTDYAKSPFKETGDIVPDYRAHIGEEAVVYGQVVNVDPVIIRTTVDSGREVRFRITGLDERPRQGEYLEVFGVVGPKYTIEAKGTIVRGQREHWYTYGISLFAVLLVLGRVGRDWTVNPDRYSIVSREKNA